MWIEPLFNHLGVPLSLGLTLVGLALPMGIAGVALRNRGRRDRVRWEVISAARVELRSIGLGRVAVVGHWRNLGGDRGAVEEGAEGEDCAVVVRDRAATPIVDGTRVLVVGFATRQTDHPRGGGYRGRTRAWVIEGDAGDPLFISSAPDFPSRALRSAHRRSVLGSALLGACIAVTVGAAALCYRAASEDGLYSDYGGSE